MSNRIPLINVSSLLLEDPRGVNTVASEIGAACEEFGFFYIEGHGIQENLIKRMFDQSRHFFGLSLGEKNKLRIGATNRGYVPYGTSTLLVNAVQKARAPDSFESLMIRDEPRPSDPQVIPGDPLHGPNRWPETLPGFRECCLEYYSSLQSLAYRFLPVFAVALGLSEDYFAPFFERPTTSLRLLHYPRPDDGQQLNGFGISPHTDYGFLTILAQDSASGLEVHSKVAGDWISAPPIPGTFVVNIGDSLSRWTNKRFVSTPHRVASMATSAERYSLPFFFHPSMDATIDVLPTCHDSDTPPIYPAVRFGDYLMKRLDTNYARARGAQHA